MSFQELVLSGTASSSLLPCTVLHALQTGTVVFSLKSAVGVGTSGGADAEGSSSSGCIPKTMSYVEAKDGMGGVVVGLGGKDGRNGANVWSFQKEHPMQKLIPPVRLSTICMSSTGQYFAGGTHDGRLFFWEVSTGHLLFAIDAHYRAITVLEFSHDDSVLISGSDDASVSVWSIGALYNTSPTELPTPFVTLSDHTLPITDLAVGLGNFPSLRIVTASMDSTCKIWDMSNSKASLLSTFAFASPVTHVALDSLERFFFVVCQNAAPRYPTNAAKGARANMGAKVLRVDLYRKRSATFGFDTFEAAGGGEEGELERVREATEYSCPGAISSLHLSRFSPTLLLGTSDANIHVLSLPALVATRIIASPLANTAPGPGPITFLSTLLKPSNLGLSDNSLAVRPVGTLGRTVKPHDGRSGGVNGKIVSMRLGKAPDARSLIEPIYFATDANKLATRSMARPPGVQDRTAQLEVELQLAREQLAKAASFNEVLWKSVVEGTLKVGKAASA